MELILTNVQLTREERAALRSASNNDTIIGGVRALIADWCLRGCPQIVNAPAPPMHDQGQDKEKA